MTARYDPNNPFPMGGGPLTPWTPGPGTVGPRPTRPESGSRPIVHRPGQPQRPPTTGPPVHGDPYGPTGTPQPPPPTVDPMPPMDDTPPPPTVDPMPPMVDPMPPMDDTPMSPMDVDPMPPMVDTPMSPTDVDPMPPVADTPMTPPIRPMPPMVDTPMPTMPTTPMSPMGGGSQPTTPPVSSGGFGGGQTTMSMPAYPAGGSDMGGMYDMGGTGGGFGGSGYRPPSRGTGPVTKNTWNIGGDTSTSSTSITKGDEYAQKKTTKPIYAKKTPKSEKIIGKTDQAMKQLANMQQNPYMRRA